MTNPPLPQLTIYENILPESQLADGYELFRAPMKLTMASGLFYVSLEYVHDGSAAARLAEYVAAPVAEFVAAHLARILRFSPPAAVRAADGIEVWNAALLPGGPACFHVDTDEMRRAKRGEVICPLLGTIFHLGPTTGLVGGETMFELGQPRGEDLEDAPFSIETWESLLIDARGRSLSRSGPTA